MNSTGTLRLLLVIKAWFLMPLLVDLCIGGGFPKSSFTQPEAEDSPNRMQMKPLICATRQLSLEYAKLLLPNRPISHCLTQQALRLHECYEQIHNCHRQHQIPHPSDALASYDLAKCHFAIYTDANSGNDKRSGTTIANAVRTIEKAVDLIRNNRRSGNGAQAQTQHCIVLLEGTYYLKDTLVFDHKDSNLVISSYNNKVAKISGGHLLSNLSWKKVPHMPHVFSTHVKVPKDMNVKTLTFSQLYINGIRAIRARFPNGNSETMGRWTKPTGLIPQSGCSSWLPLIKRGKAENIIISSPKREGHFRKFRLGIYGPASVYEPPESFWGIYSTRPVETHVVPSGVAYKKASFTNKTWGKPSTGILHALHGMLWGGWQFPIDARSNRTIKWSRGGYQEARGLNYGADSFVENILEELDAPGEYYFDETNSQLYLYPNETSIENVGEIITDRLITLFRIKGDQNQPASNILLHGLTFAHTSTTFLEKYAVPSGGDVSLYKGGAVVFEGATGCGVKHCLFDRLGGNGLFLKDYVRQFKAIGNEFRWIGDNAIASVGSSTFIDATKGNYPHGTLIEENLFREVGVYGKQASAYFQSLTSNTTIRSNVLFNGPRAGINFNDGFAGGHVLERNLAFSFVRETSDHGVFNSWDRQPYLTLNSSGMPSLQASENYIRYNLFTSDYGSTWPIDHDDGSANYTDTYNVLLFGGSKNLFGHSKKIKHNLFVYPDFNLGNSAKMSSPFCLLDIGVELGISGYAEEWTHNRCVIGSGNVYGISACNAKDMKPGLIPKLESNYLMAPKGKVWFQCGPTALTLAQFNKLGYEINTVVKDLPPLMKIKEMIRTTLKMKELERSSDNIGMKDDTAISWVIPSRTHERTGRNATKNV